MTEVLASLPAPDLQVFVVWQPILREDDHDAANRNARVFDDPRMVHMWDGANIQGVLWNRKLGLPERQLAWDVFIVLPRGATWDGDLPPTPVYWSHQLEMMLGIKYDAAALRQAIKDALETQPARAIPHGKAGGPVDTTKEHK